uniref:Uncharacterized protein n=1 Tax=Triticum urartu TaxID=4572 RepID=A0A8R7R3A1_TRIUA
MKSSAVREHGASSETRRPLLRRAHLLPSTDAPPLLVADHNAAMTPRFHSRGAGYRPASPPCRRSHKNELPQSPPQRRCFALNFLRPLLHRRQLSPTFLVNSL